MWGVAAVVLAVGLAHLLQLSGLVVSSPLAIVGNLATHTGPQLLRGQPFTDPNAGFTAQALGHLAASDWLHGRVPWWNPYEGLGAPLAGEMQSAALFPPVLLQALPHGLLVFDIALELSAGLATRALLRRLGVGEVAAAAAGAAFAVNGTFAWFSHAPINPIPFLPLALLGVERALAAARSARPGGWVLLAVAIAGSIYAGFPETAYLDGLLVVVWAVARAPAAGRARAAGYLGRIAAGGAVGLLLAAPILVAFLDYLPQAALAGHTSVGYGTLHLTARAIPALVLPYLYGPTMGLWGYVHALDNGTPLLYAIEVNVGGFVSIALVVLGCAGLVGRRLRGLRLTLLAVIAVVVLRNYTATPVAAVLDLVPGVAHAVFYRYSLPVLELALTVLAGLGLDALVAPRPDRRAALVGALSGAAVLGGCLLLARPVLADLRAAPHVRDYVGASLGWALVVIVTVGFAGALVRSRRVRAVVLAGALALDAVAMFAVATASAPTSATIDTAAVSWLRGHLGDYRFLSDTVFQPNYGSYFRLASLNVNDLPVPAAYVRSVSAVLEPGAAPDSFARISGPELRANISRIAADGVRYLVAPAGPDPLLYPAPVVASGPGGERWPLDRVRTDVVRQAPGGELAAVDVVVDLPERAARHARLLVRVCVRGARRARCAPGAVFLTGLAGLRTVEARLTRGDLIEVGARLDVAVGYRGPGPVPSLVAAAGRRGGPERFVLTLRYAPSTAPVSPPAYSDSLLAVYRVPGARPLASAPGCRIYPRGPQVFAVSCPAPAVLTYRELDLHGSSASLDGRPAALRRDGVLQQVALPAGRSVVAFSYAPPRLALALAAMLLGFLACIASPVARRLPARPGHGRRRHGGTPDRRRALRR